MKTKDKLADGSLAFLGAGLYGPLKGLGLKRFIDRSALRGRKVALFGTSGGGKGIGVEPLKDSVTSEGAEVVGTSNRRRRFLFLLWNHPTGKDPEDARRFACEVAGG